MIKIRIKNQELRIKGLTPIILIIIALVLGYAINNQQQKTKSSSSTPSTSTPILLPQSLSEDERFILNPPSEDASQSAKDKHRDIVAKLAKEGSILEIKDCKPDILVLQVKEGSELEIKNMDSSDHRIIFDSENIFTIPANGSEKIKAQFKYGTGDYGYVCEGVGLIGFLHIIP